MEQFGGHKFAAGLTLKAENLTAFSEKFESVVESSIHADLLIPEIKVEAILNLAQIDAKFYRILAQMAPFGPENTNPIFMSENVILAATPQIVGTKHLKISVKQQNSAIFESIAFGMAAYMELLTSDQPFSICYTIEENIWRERKRLQLNIKGIKIATIS
ncbi:Single-stranded-DNA-specific exonuclease RecJ [compost metagenome]